MINWSDISKAAKLQPERCNSRISLEVHHIRRDGGNGLDNAEVLCQECHEHTATYGEEGLTPPPFSEKTKQAALKRANYKCECTRKNCHNKENGK